MTQQVTRRAEVGIILSAEERLEVCASIARDERVPPRARLAALRLDAELRGGFNQTIENHEIIVDLVDYTIRDPVASCSNCGHHEGADNS